jgi:hypothetical protein
MDFDKLLSQIPYLGESEYRLLKIIRDNEVLNSAKDKINEYYEKILDIYEKYKLGGFRIIGVYYPQLIEAELFKIISFYTNNYIIADEFSNTTKVIKKGIEALLISFATNENYDERLKEFDKDFFNITVHYANSEDIKKITQKFEISTIVFNEKNLSEILESVDNFLKSFFLENNFFGNKTLEDKTTKNQISEDFFERKCKKIFNNIFIILSGVILTKEQAPNLIQNLIDFIKHENFIHINEIKSLCSFIYKNYQLFSKDDFEKLLESIFTKVKFYKNGHLFQAIAFAFSQNKFEGISKRSLILTPLIISERNDDNLNIVNLWSISNEEIKEELKQRIILRLDEKFNNDLYVSAAKREIIDYNQYFEEYIKFVDSTKGNGDYTLESDKPRMQSFVFINAMIFIYNMNVKHNDKRLEAFTNLTDYMKFYLNPEDFDYTNFKVEWLYIVGDIEVFYKRFSKIPALKKEIEKSLKEKFNSKLAELYAKYFIN